MSTNTYQCNLDWGADGSRRAAERNEIVVIIDCLSFSTAVVTAVEHGAVIYPCGRASDATTLKGKTGTELAVKRPEVPKLGRFSLSPLTLLGVEDGSKIILPSLNGASCVEAASGAHLIFAGALINARAIAAALNGLVTKTGRSITLIACGELDEAGNKEIELRQAVEDYLSAGAILDELDIKLSPEAQECRRHFIGSKEKIADIIWNSPSGVWLEDRGFGNDVEYASRLNRFDCVPVLRQGIFEDWDLSGGQVQS